MRKLDECRTKEVMTGLKNYLQQTVTVLENCVSEKYLKNKKQKINDQTQDLRDACGPSSTDNDLNQKCQIWFHHSIRPVAIFLSVQSTLQSFSSLFLSHIHCHPIHRHKIQYISLFPNCFFLIVPVFKRLKNNNIENNIYILHL